VTRSTSILIRVSPEEAETFKAAAQRAGLGVGPWLRSLGGEAARRTCPHHRLSVTKELGNGVPAAARCDDCGYTWDALALAGRPESFGPDPAPAGRERAPVRRKSAKSGT
jgi:hypothetical protein